MRKALQTVTAICKTRRSNVAQRLKHTVQTLSCRAGWKKVGKRMNLLSLILPPEISELIIAMKFQNSNNFNHLRYYTLSKKCMHKFHSFIQMHPASITFVLPELSLCPFAPSTFLLLSANGGKNWFFLKNWDFDLSVTPIWMQLGAQHLPVSLGGCVCM